MAPIGDGPDGPAALQVLLGEGVPIDAALAALALLDKGGSLGEAFEICVMALPDLDAALLAQAELIALRSELASLVPAGTSRAPESAAARDPYRTARGDQ